MEIRKGATRVVIVGRRRAYKLPSFQSWKLFLCGLLANMQEVEFSAAEWPELCPVVWSLPLGFLVVMPTVEVCSDEEELDYEALTEREEYVIPAEHKPSSWGRLNGRIVAIDYGS